MNLKSMMPSLLAGFCIVSVLSGCTSTPMSPRQGAAAQRTSSTTPATGMAEPTTQPPVELPPTKEAIAAQLRSKVVAGEGWGVVKIGAKRSEIEALLGKADYDEVDPNDSRFVFFDYTKLGVDVLYDTKLDRVTQVTFVKGATDMVGAGYFGNPDFVPFKGTTNRGIGWVSTPAQVKAAYGTKGMDDHPNDADGHDKGRDIRYPGITFYFPDARHLKVIYVWSE